MKRKFMVMVLGCCMMSVSACAGRQPQEETALSSSYPSPEAGEQAKTEDGGENDRGENDGEESGREERVPDSEVYGAESHGAEAPGTGSGLQKLPPNALPGLNMRDPQKDAPSGNAGEGLLSGATIETSALTLFTYDGKTVRNAYMFDSEKGREVLEGLNAADAKEVTDWSPQDASPPFYGIEIGGGDGQSILAAWADGHWISQDGTVYRFDYDFKHLSEAEGWEGAGELPSFTSFPCARLFAQETGRWNTGYLVPAAGLTPPEGISMELESWEGGTAEVVIKNGSGQEWSFGEFYELQAKIDVRWYEIPTVPGNWGFSCIGYYLPDGESQRITNYLDMYGELPPGVYRLVIGGLSVEHEVR